MHCFFSASISGAEILRMEVCFKSKTIMPSFCTCVRNMKKNNVTFVIEKLEFFLFSFSPLTRMPFSNLAAFHFAVQRASCVKGERERERERERASKNKLLQLKTKTLGYL